MGTVVDAKVIEIVQVRDGDRGLSNVIGMRGVLPRLEKYRKALAHHLWCNICGSVQTPLNKEQEDLQSFTHKLPIWRQSSEITAGFSL